MKARDNPFAAHRTEQLAFRFPAGDSWSALLGRLERNDWRAAIVGPHGTGKTTLLEQLGSHLKAHGFDPKLVTLRTESTLQEKRALLASESIHAPTLLLVDGAEQLTPTEWRQFETRTRSAAGLIITQHTAGRLPSVLETAPSPALLADLASELSSAPLAADEARQLLAKHGGNIRASLRELYDRWATM